jgi:hypothetical protein
MSDHGSDVEKPTSPIEDLPDPPPKQKRQMSEKQLANLAKAREKARISLTKKKERTKKLKEQEKKLKELKLKEKEDRIQAEMKALQLEPSAEETEKPAPEKKAPKKKKKKQKVVYVSESSDSSSSEEEVVYVKKPRRKGKHAPAPASAKPPRAPTIDSIRRQETQNAEDAAVRQKYDQEVLRLKKQYLMEQVFPNM